MLLLSKNKQLHWENLITYKNIGGVYQAYVSFSSFSTICNVTLKWAASIASTAAAKKKKKKGNTIPRRGTAPSQAVLSFRASHQWNAATQPITGSLSYHRFKVNAKDWLTR